MKAKDLELYEQDQLHDKLNLKPKKQNKMSKLKTINIKGKEYVTVNERIKYFREHFTGYSIETKITDRNNAEIIIMDGKERKKSADITIKAVIKNPERYIVSTGYAYEKEISTFINKTSFVENCETSAIGRALGNFGIGIDQSVASADEVANAIKNQ